MVSSESTNNISDISYRAEVLRISQNKPQKVKEEEENRKDKITKIFRLSCRDMGSSYSCISHLKYALFKFYWLSILIYQKDVTFLCGITEVEKERLNSNKARHNCYDLQ
ncbi:hypothetical protein C922_05693 [Plasmodium inui San Antonio 1]|uniref:Uncharacterized protein n=1 Tax=Plasmodium inui San Antonio 1 TaxID=1237626 RepID=W6ZXD9_9APIC|nr:hypothetical protein C922_05693 [Plasmodium inui San Antonio 1]EUD63925.1 hypothetical protein C922_05693 [Plasmodium inui San Antonio 1]